ncbi:MAG: WG repeat-containing protein [Candidatus Rifleibacteriota bacterium]
MKFCRLHVAIIVFILISGVLQAKHLLPIKADAAGKYGFINEAGELKISPQYDDAGRFFDGIAAVQLDGNWFFIDETGRNKFSKTFSEVRNFSEGMAAVKANEVWGYLDREGKLAIDFKFVEAYPFSEGLACVQTGNKEDGSARYGYIDQKGSFVIEPCFKYHDNQFFSWPGEFSEGKAAVWLENENGHAALGFIDRNGKAVISPSFNQGSKFGNGLAAVSTSDDIAGCYRYIKTDGVFAFSTEFAGADRFSDGLAPVAIKTENEDESSWGYINPNGEMIIKEQFAYAEPFEKGLAKVFVGDFSNEAYIDTTGKIIQTTEGLINNPLRLLTPDNYSCSSFLPPAKNGKIDYKPANVGDGDSKTAWIEGSKGDGVGEWIELQYEGECLFKQIKFLNGYQKTSDAGKSLFKKNLRPAKIKISNEKNESLQFELEDSEKEQVLSINLRGFNLRIEILSIHRTGKEDPDAGFSEISIFGTF